MTARICVAVLAALLFTAALPTVAVAGWDRTAVYAESSSSGSPSPAATGTPQAPSHGLAGGGARTGAGVIVLVALVGALLFLRSRLDRGRR